MRLPAKAPEGVDAILCAGDLCYSYQISHWAQEIISRYNLPLILVPGNHEFFESKEASHRVMAGKRNAMQRLAHESIDWPKRLIVLDDSTTCFGDVQIIGGTLWTDFRLDAISDSEVAWRMNDAISLAPDFSNIYMSRGRPMMPEDALKMHRKTAAFIRQQLKGSSNRKKLVLTHHLPHPDCTPQEYLGDRANFLYASSSDAFADVLESEHAPDLWVCGHTHQGIDVKVGRTRIVANPYGFQADGSEAGNSFSWNFVVEV